MHAFGKGLEKLFRTSTYSIGAPRWRSWSAMCGCIVEVAGGLLDTHRETSQEEKYEKGDMIPVQIHWRLTKLEQLSSFHSSYRNRYRTHAAGVFVYYNDAERGGV